MLWEHLDMAVLRFCVICFTGFRLHVLTGNDWVSLDFEPIEKD